MIAGCSVLLSVLCKGEKREVNRTREAIRENMKVFLTFLSSSRSGADAVSEFRRKQKERKKIKKIEAMKDLDPSFPT